MSGDEGREEEIKELFQGFHSRSISGEPLARPLEVLQRFYSGLVLDDKHIEAFKELRAPVKNLEGI